MKTFTYFRQTGKMKISYDNNRIFSGICGINIGAILTSTQVCVCVRMQIALDSVWSVVADAISDCDADGIGVPSWVIDYAGSDCSSR